MKQGFMLIELIIATLIASMVAGVLLTALSQSTRVQTSVDNVIDMSVRIGVVANQLEKDLMGAFIPTQAVPQEEEKKEQAVPADKKDDAGKKDSTEQKGVEKEKPKPIEKIFYSTNKDGRFDTLTFITNNPLVVYVGKDVGEVKPKVVRVQYSLKLEPDKKNSYTLFRQESMELDLEKFKNTRAYEVISGIKNCTVTFTARIEKKEESSSAKATADTATSKANAKVSYEYKTQNEWTSEQKKEADKEQSAFPRIPYNVEIKLLLWDRQDKKEKEFTIICNIPVDFTAPKKEDKKEPEPPKEDKDQTGAAVGDKPVMVTQDGQGKTLGPTVVTVLQDVTRMLGQRNS
jgi:type II secretory pathway component PulJ